MKVALDSNILLYAQGLNDAPCRARATAAIERLIDWEIVVAAQVLGKFAVLTSDPRCHGAVAGSLCRGTATERVLLRAADLSTDHRLFIWDA